MEPQDRGDRSDRRPPPTERERQIGIALDVVVLLGATWNTVLLLTLGGSTAPTAVTTAGAALGTAEIVLRVFRLRQH